MRGAAVASGTAPDSVADDPPEPSERFLGTPWRMRIYLTLVCVAAVVAAIGTAHREPTDHDLPQWLTALVLIAVSVLNVEISRALAGGLERANQPHKTLSAWAFASALILPPPWLLLVVPITYSHARWRGLRLPLWKWVGSGFYLIAAGTAASLVGHAILGRYPNLMHGTGGRGLGAMVAAAATFLTIESVLLAGSALLNHRQHEVWLRHTLTTLSFYATESGVLLIGGLLAAVWTGGAWFVLCFVPVYALIQRAALHDPLRERADAAVLLAAKNDELELANQFKIDLMGMLGHEIGNPLTAIQGYAEIGADAMQDGEFARAEEAFTVLSLKAAQIGRVLHDILDLVRSDRGALTAHPESCGLESHLRSAAATQPAGRQPRVDCPAGLAAMIQPGHLDQILANLLTNAQKYAGGATELVARPVGAGRVEVAVSDAGPGVPPAFREHLFERFSRNAETAQKVMGTGLGLFITRELARANGADVIHRDGTPTGSVFVLTMVAPPA